MRDVPELGEKTAPLSALEAELAKVAELYRVYLELAQVSAHGVSWLTVRWDMPENWPHQADAPLSLVLRSDPKHALVE
jgi:hypothetical protein